MKCGKVQLLLDEYLRGSLPSGEMNAVAEHLVSCDTCSAELEFLKRYRERLASVPPLRAPAGFLAKVREGIAAGDSEKVPAARRGIVKKLFLPLKIKLPLEAAGLLATAALVFVLVKPTLDESMLPAPTIPQQDQEIAAAISPEHQERRATRPQYHAGARTKKAAKTARVSQEKTATPVEIDLAISTQQSRDEFAAGEPLRSMRKEREAPSVSETGDQVPGAQRSRSAKADTAGGIAPARQATVQFTSAEQIVKIKKMIRPLGGRIIGENSAAGERPAYVRVELPEANYAKFVDQLNQVGQVTRQPARRAVQNRRSVDVQVNVVEQK